MRIQFREDQPLRVAWDLLQILSGVVTGVCLPIAVLAPSQHYAWPQLWLLLSALGCLDILVVLRTSVELEGTLTLNSRLIARRYLKSWLGTDLLANLPVLLGFAAGPGLWLQALRCTKIFRIISRWQALQLFNPLILQILKYVFGLTLLINGTSASWLWLGLSNLNSDSWIQRTSLQDAGFETQYLASVYWSVATLASVGYGDITPRTWNEVVLAIVVMIMGVLTLAVAIGNVVSILNQLDSGRSQFRNHQTALRQYLKFNGVSRTTLDRLRRYHDYQWKRFRGLRPEFMLQDLPVSFRSEVTLEILSDHLSEVPLFSKSPARLKSQLAILLRWEFYPPGSILLRKGEPGDSLVFIIKGAAVIEADGAIGISDRQYHSGDYLGDLSFFLKERRTSNVITKEFTEALILDRALFDQLIEEEPILRDIIRGMASTRSERNQNLLLAGVVI